MKAYQIMEEILEELSIFEDLESTITKKYGPMFGDKSTPEGGRLHGKAIEANVNEIVRAAKRNLPDEEKNSMTAIEKEMGKIGARRNNTKNKIGEYRTKARSSRYRNFPVDWNSPKTDAEKAEGSIKRKFKKDKSFPVFQALRSLKSKQNSSEALDIMEEIINEVSIGMWKKAAANSLPKRQEEAETAKASAEKGWEEYDKQARKHPEEEPALYRLAQANDEAGVKSEDRAEHAKDVSKLMVHNKVNANKAIKAAKKVSAKREDAFGGAPSAKTLRRSVKANQLVYADPNYKNEALGVNEDKEAALSQLHHEYDKEAENIPSGSKEMYELNKKYGKLKKKVEKHFDKNEALELAEAIINEFTEADKKEAAKKVLPERKREYLSKYADVLDAADEVGSENVPDGNLKDLERAGKRYKHAEKVANEALSLAESIIGYADNIFELDYENKQNVNTNKIRKLKKDKDGENVEVVSVADELFPYEGNAKQQFNQKVLAKINDMIEGKGSLEDLIQFVRKYSGNRKSANESTEISEGGNFYEVIGALEEIKQVIEGLFVNDGRGDLLNDIDNALGSPVKKTAKDMVKQCTGCKQKKVK